MKTKKIALALLIAAVISPVCMTMVSANDLPDTEQRQEFQKGSHHGHRGEDRGGQFIERLAEVLGMTEEELKAEMEEARESGISFEDYLESKGLSEEEIQEILPKKGPRGEHGGRCGGGKLIERLAEVLGMTEAELKAEMEEARESGISFEDYLESKGLSEEEIQEILPKRGPHPGHGGECKRGKFIEELAEILGMTEAELKEEMEAARESGISLEDFLAGKGLTEEEIQDILPKRGPRHDHHERTEQ